MTWAGRSPGNPAASGFGQASGGTSSKRPTSKHPPSPSCGAGQAREIPSSNACGGTFFTEGNEGNQGRSRTGNAPVSSQTNKFKAPSSPVRAERRALPHFGRYETGDSGWIRGKFVFGFGVDFQGICGDSGLFRVVFLLGKTRIKLVGYPHQVA